MKKIKTPTEKHLEELQEKGGITSILSKILDIKNDSIEDNTRILLNYGWYITAQMKMKRISDVIDFINSGEIEVAESILINFFNENLEKIEEHLAAKHSDRKDIIKEAFKAHKSKMFYSSTILFLSQGDGFMGGRVFHKRMNLDDHLNKDKNPKFVKILKEDSSLNVHSNEVDKLKYFSKLNRHSVMHGISTNYGNKKNSLRALSFCCFVSDWYNRYNE